MIKVLLFLGISAILTYELTCLPVERDNKRPPPSDIKINPYRGQKGNTGQSLPAHSSPRHARDTKQESTEVEDDKPKLQSIGKPASGSTLPPSLLLAKTHNLDTRDTKNTPIAKGSTLESTETKKQQETSDASIQTIPKKPINSQPRHTRDIQKSEDKQSSSSNPAAKLDEVKQNVETSSSQNHYRSSPAPTNFKNTNERRVRDTQKQTDSKPSSNPGATAEKEKLTVQSKIDESKPQLDTDEVKIKRVSRDTHDHDHDHNHDHDHDHDHAHSQSQGRSDSTKLKKNGHDRNRRDTQNQNKQPSSIPSSKLDETRLAVEKEQTDKYKSQSKIGGKQATEIGNKSSGRAVRDTDAQKQENLKSSPEQNEKKTVNNNGGKKTNEKEDSASPALYINRAAAETAVSGA